MAKERFIPVNVPAISKEAKDNVSEALDSGWISSAGEFVKRFEEEFPSYIGVDYGVFVSSGTAAIHTALVAAEIGSEDEIIVPAFTMASTWLPALYVGAKPVFVDCEDDTFNINPKLIEDKITERTKAIIPVHIYGHPVDMGQISEIAERHDLLVIEDAAEAHGAEYRGQKCGSFGDISCFSFYANKLITTGEGGMLLTNSRTFYEKARKIRDLHHSDKRFIHDGIGFNYRATNMQAGMGLGELENIDYYLEKKEKIAELYKQGLDNVPGLSLPVRKTYATRHSYWMYGVLVDEQDFGLSRDELSNSLLQKGVDTRDFFYPPNAQPILRNYLGESDNFPVTEEISSKGLYLPSGLAISEEDIKYVCQKIIECQKAS